MEKIFRYSIKAVIIRDGKLLVESCDYGRGRFCKLPGGGHQWGETMEQALIRECREELNLTVRPERLPLRTCHVAAAARSCSGGRSVPAFSESAETICWYSSKVGAG